MPTLARTNSTSGLKWTSNYLINLSRIFLLGLVCYELVNLFGILHNPLTFTWNGLTLTSVPVWAGLEIILFFTKKWASQINFGIVMIGATAGVYADAIGDMYLLYDKIHNYDKIMHFLGGGVICGWIVFEILRNLEDNGKIRLGIIGVGFFAWMTTAFFGVLYELSEYFEDVFTGVHIRLGDGPDTTTDLMHNELGSLLIISILVIYFYARSVKIRRANSPNDELANGQ